MSFSYVVLFIQAHGNENLEHELVGSENVRLLSFSGEPNTSGMMSICPDGESLNMKALRIATASLKRSKEPEKSMKASIQTLEQAYADSSIHFEDGFRITVPISERTFYFYPNTDEDPKLCPEYGLSVIQSSNPVDHDHTLESNWCTQDTSGKKNMHMNRRTAKLLVFQNRKTTRNLPSNL